MGVTELLDALAFCGLPPDAVAPHGRRTPTAKTVEVKADPAGPLVAQVFKTRIDPFVQKLSFIRVFSGTLKSNETVPVVGVRKGVKLGQLFEVQADETEPIDEAGPGADRGRDQDGRPAHRHVAGRADAAADPLPHADGRPGGHAQEPRRRGQALRRPAQDREEDPTFRLRLRSADQGNGGLPA